MTQLQEWADQYRAEIEKESSARAAQVESLLIAGDYEAIREWLQEWEEEDKVSGSLRSRYRETRLELRQERYRQRQHQLKGSMLDRVTGKASTKSLTRSGADLHSLPRPSKQFDRSNINHARYITSTPPYRVRAARSGYFLCCQTRTGRARSSKHPEP